MQHSSEETSQRWRVVGDTVFIKTDQGIVHQTSPIDGDEHKSLTHVIHLIIIESEILRVVKQSDGSC